MLNSFRIRQFKLWRDSGPIRLAPITVICGANSAGKSSIGQLLLMLKQTAESPDRTRVLHTGDSGSYVDLGIFSNLLHQHQQEQELAFEIAWTPWEGEATIGDAESKQGWKGDEFRFTARIRQDDPDGAIYVQEFNYTVVSDGRDQVGAGVRHTQDEPHPSKKGAYKLDLPDGALKRRPGRPNTLSAPVRFYGFPPEVDIEYRNAAFLADLQYALEKRLQNIHYVGPLREPPKRGYGWSGERTEHVGSRGERAIEAILGAQAMGREIACHRGDNYYGLDYRVAQWLQKMGLVYSFKVQRIAEGRKEYEVLVRTRQRGPWVHLNDVGFGVSQVLPVIVEAFSVPRGSLILLEQPEIHLHPEVQSDLGDLFVKAIQARDRQPGIAADDRGVQFLVETHSEHLVRRLQRRVAEGELDQEDIALYFCQTNQDNTARLEELHVDRFGNITNWPENFFGDDMADLLAMVDAAAEAEREDRDD